ncbi:MAG: hypothetical protein CMN56_05235 [Sneathiella sp.]|uniref:hypothetical protein n=1 Tax=Sneathiella sp. TaxID=1964365 RepID=UPI000C53D347|nr:hypothetical protein [Sneathiella sp.]MAZ02523.1 hypothetical protein [Sneathiella sp.]|tara:strand:- start:954 stop:1142 length:189 start_codon:yes stop_codon:yes gene_type:complete
MIEVEISGETAPGVRVMADIPAHMIRGDAKPFVKATTDPVNGRFGFRCEGLPVGVQFVVPKE